MPPLVAIDARDAVAPQLRGWGRYAGCLLEALQQLADRPFALEPIFDGGRGPEVLFEQVGMPLLLRRRRASLVHATNCFLPLLRPCPGVVTIHDLAFETWPEDFPPRTRAKYRFFARRAVASAQRVICPSAYTAQDVRSRYGAAPEKLRVVPNAPALPLGDLDPPSGRFIVAVGDLRRKKNLASLVHAWVRLRVEAAIPHRLVLAGVDTGEGPRLRQIASGQPLEITGYLGDAQLDALIRGAELLVHPSLYEGFGLVMAEAMVRGTPVLAASSTALPETGGDAVAYFDPADPEHLWRRLAALLDDPDERARLAVLGRERAAGFSWERSARETADVYRELL